MKNYLSKYLVESGYKNYKELYIDWVNNFITISGFADYHNLDDDIAKELIDNACWLYGNRK
jgi:hypothetical protein